MTTYTYLNINSYIKIYKRFYPGGSKKPYGHINKILDTLSKKPPKTLPLQTSINENNNSILQSQQFDEKPKQTFLNKLFPFDVTRKNNLITHENAIAFSQNNKNCYTVLTPDSPHVLQGKEIIILVAKHLETFPIESIHEPQYHIIKFIKQLSPEQLLCRYGQVSFEITFNKLTFSEKLIHETYPNIKMVDIIGRNEGLVDMSTIYSVCQINHLLKNPLFERHIDPCIIQTTCINSHDIKTINNPQIQQPLKSSQEATGNSLSDSVLLNNFFYDFKNTADISYTKNHIIFINYIESNLSQKPKIFLYQMERHFIQRLRINPEDTFTQKMLAFYVNNLKDESSLTGRQKLDFFNSKLFELMHTRQVGHNFPIVYPFENKPYEPNINLIADMDSIKLPISKTVQSKIVKNVLEEMLSNKSPNIQDKIKNITLGSLCKNQTESLNKSIADPENII